MTKYALVRSFSGAPVHFYAEKSNDMTITGFINPGLYGSDGDYKIDDSGLAKLTLTANKKVNKIPEGVIWTDGQPPTLKTSSTLLRRGTRTIPVSVMVLTSRMWLHGRLP